jgi:hypothetical protein
MRSEPQLDDRIAPEDSMDRGVRVAAALLIIGLVAGPAAEHLYWMLGGTWTVEDATSATGVRVVAAFVVMLIAAAVLVVLARVGWWRQTFVSDRVTRVLAWGLAFFFVGHGLVSFAEGLAGVQVEWWLYGPAGLVLGLLAFVVAGSGGRWRIHRPHRTLPSH